MPTTRFPRRLTARGGKRRSIARRPVVVTQPDGSESIAIHSTGIVGVSWDHRAVDGAYVSLFLAKVAELLGSRDWAAEL